MKKLKKRIKRALAAFLKDELLEIVKYSYPHPSFPVSNEVHLHPETFRIEYKITVTDESEFEYALQQAKDKIAQHIIQDHLVVDTRELMDPQYAYCRSVEISVNLMKPRR